MEIKRKKETNAEGMIIRGYSIEKWIGKGSFGSVYLGYNTQDKVKRLLAIKVINRK